MVNQFAKHDDQLQLFAAVKNYHTDRLMNLPNVWGTGVGLKYKDGKVQDELSVVVLVSQKETLSSLAEDKVIPSVLSMSKEQLMLTDPTAINFLSHFSEDITVKTDVIVSVAPVVTIMKGASWNETCVGAGANTDVYYGMPLFNAPNRNSWIGNCAIVAYTKNRQKVLVSNKHALQGQSHIYNKNGKLVASGIVVSNKFDAAYANIHNGIQTSNLFTNKNKEINTLELGQGWSWHMQSFSASTGFKDYHLEWSDCTLKSSSYSDPSYNRWRVFKDWTIGANIPVTGSGDSGTGIIGDGGGINALHSNGTEDVNKNCQGQTARRYRWAVPIEDVFNDLGLTII